MRCFHPTCTNTRCMPDPPFQPPIGADPRYVGDLPPATLSTRERIQGPFVGKSRIAEAIAHGFLAFPVVGSAPKPQPMPETPTYVGAELAGVKSRIADLEKRLAKAKTDEKKVQVRQEKAINHEKEGEKIMHTCPDGSRHKWLCVEWRQVTDYTDLFPMRSRKALYRCGCGAKATIE